MRLLVLFLAALLLSSACTGSPNLAGAPKVASVGYAVFTVVDSSRSLRPVQVAVWYPSSASLPAMPMTLGEYAHTIPVEGTERPVTPEVEAAGRRELEDYLVSLGATREGAHGALDMRLSAHAQALPLPRSRLATIVFALGKDESPVLHADLAERLAWSGFLVVTVPTVGTSRRATAWAPEDIASHADDLFFALRVATRRQWTDTTRLGAIGYSYGSGAAVLTAQRLSGMRALVLLDGSLAFRDRLPTFETALAGVRVSAPVMSVTARNDVRVTLSLLRRIAPRAAVTISDSTGHLDFATLALVAARPGFQGFTRLGDDLLPPGVVYARVTGSVIAFMTRHVRP